MNYIEDFTQKRDLHSYNPRVFEYLGRMDSNLVKEFVEDLLRGRRK